MGDDARRRRVSARARGAAHCGCTFRLGRAPGRLRTPPSRLPTASRIESRRPAVLFPVSPLRLAGTPQSPAKGRRGGEENAGEGRNGEARGEDRNARAAAGKTPALLPRRKRQRRGAGRGVRGEFRASGAKSARSRVRSPSRNRSATVERCLWDTPRQKRDGGPRWGLRARRRPEASKGHVGSRQSSPRRRAFIALASMSPLPSRVTWRMLHRRGAERVETTKRESERKRQSAERGEEEQGRAKRDARQTVGSAASHLPRPEASESRLLVVVGTRRDRSLDPSKSGRRSIPGEPSSPPPATGRRRRIETRAPSARTVTGTAATCDRASMERDPPEPEAGLALAEARPPPRDDDWVRTWARPPSVTPRAWGGEVSPPRRARRNRASRKTRLQVQATK